MSIELKDSGTVTAISVVGFVFGLLGMLISFIPCFGAAGLYLSIPAIIISSIGLTISYIKNSKKTFAIVALTISLIGAVIAFMQYRALVG